MCAPMRGIGNPRAASALAKLPQRGRRGCPILGSVGAFRRGLGSSPEDSGGGVGGRGGVGGSTHGSGSWADEAESEHRREERTGDGQRAGRGNGGPVRPQGSSLGRGRGAPIFPVGREKPFSTPLSVPPPPLQLGWSGGIGRGSSPPVPNGSVSRDGAGATPLQTVNSEPGDGQVRLSLAAEEAKPSAAEALLAKLGGLDLPSSAPSGSSAAPAAQPNPPFRMPFAAPEPPARETPEARVQVSTPLPLPSSGRGRGQPGVVAQPGIGPAPDREDRIPESASPDSTVQTRRTADRGPQTRARRERPPRRPSPPGPQLSAEEASARAMAILEKGIESSVAAEGERRRKAGLYEFADAAEFLTSRLRRAADRPSSSSQVQGPRRDERQRQRSGARRGPRQRRAEDEMAVSGPAVEEVELTPEQEEQLLQIQEEDDLKDRLHTLFLTQFEPEYAMEDFGTNPDIDEPPVLSLEEYLQSQRPHFLREGAGVTEEQQWQEAVAASLAQAPKLEKLVEAYAGRGRMTARQQIAKLQSIHGQLPPSVSPEAAAFSQRALVTLQNNPHLRLGQKERLMTSIVAGFSSS